MCRQMQHLASLKRQSGVGSREGDTPRITPKILQLIEGVYQMMEHCLPSRSLARRAALAATLTTLAIISCAAFAQNSTDTSDGSHNYSSSLEWKSYLNTDNALGEAL